MDAPPDSGPASLSSISVAITSNHAITVLRSSFGPYGFFIWYRIQSVLQAALSSSDIIYLTPIPCETV